jgi:TonB family protein
MKTRLSPVPTRNRLCVSIVRRTRWLACSLAGAPVLLTLGAPTFAQPVAVAPTTSAPVGSTAQLTPMERAQRDADKVFYWVRLHGNTQARPPVAQSAAAGASSKPTGATASAAPGAVAPPAPKRQPQFTRTAAATSAGAIEPASSDHVPSVAGDDKLTPGAGAEAPAQNLSAAETPVVEQGVKEPDPPVVPVPSTVPGENKDNTPPAAASVADTSARAPTEAGVSDTAPAAPPTVDERLQPIAQPAPDFPPALVQALRRGTVRVLFNVMQDGTVAGAEVINTSNRQLVPAALAAIQQWRFQPLARTQSAQVDLAFNID